MHRITTLATKAVQSDAAAYSGQLLFGLLRGGYERDYEKDGQVPNAHCGPPMSKIGATLGFGGLRSVAKWNILSRELFAAANGAVKGDHWCGVPHRCLTTAHKGRHGREA
jgi:hypothetical protein